MGDVQTLASKLVGSRALHYDSAWHGLRTPPVNVDGAKRLNENYFLGGEPGRNAYTHPMHDVRSRQMGLCGAVGERFGKGEGVTAISNVTPLFRAIGDHLKNGNIDAARASLLYYTFVFINLSCVGWRTGILACTRTSHLSNGVRFRAAAQDVRQRRR